MQRLLRPASLRQRRAAAEADRRPRHGRRCRWMPAKIPTAPRKAPAKPWWPLALAGAMALASEIVEWFGLAPDWVVAGLALLAILGAGLPTYRKGWIALKNRNLNINAPDEYRRDRRRAHRPVAGSGDGQRAVRHRRVDRGEVPGSRAQRHPRPAATGSGTGHRAGRRRMEGTAGQASGTGSHRAR